MKKFKLTNSKVLIISGFLLLASGIAAYDWRLSCIVMGTILALAGMEII